MGGYEEIFNYKELYILEINNPQIRIRVIDKYLKKLGYILSSGQRSELKKEKSIVISGLWVVEVIEDKIYIAPYIKEVMPKRYKEACRIAKIPLKIRGYIYREQITPKLLVGL